MRYVDGEYISLLWDGFPDAYYIKGHVSHEKGILILLDEGVIEDTITGIGQARHIYGRWSMESGTDGNQHFLREYSSSGRGRFKITVFDLGIFAGSN